MTARILIVDDIVANVKLLEVRLMVEYFEVLSASNGEEALKICQEGLCDIVLLDVMMPGMNGYEVCKKLKADQRTAHLPVIMVTSLDQPSDKLQGLEAGADDFLSKPINDFALITRVKSLARLKMVSDELRLRYTSGLEFGLEGFSNPFTEPDGGHNGRIMVVEDQALSAKNFVRILSKEHNICVVDNHEEALFRAVEEHFDLIIVSHALKSYDALRLCSQIRSIEQTRSVPIILAAQNDHNDSLFKAIELGVNDYIMRPIEANELLARTRTQIKRVRLNEKLRESIRKSMEMAIKDGLTGLNNRRFFDNQIKKLFDESKASNTPLALMIMDIDHFKQVNDTYGHPAGDDVLRAFANRLAKNVREGDIACRFGGEEFVIALPNTDQQLAYAVADRMRVDVAAHPFVVDDGTNQIAVTMSAGTSSILPTDQNYEELLKRADHALYQAKQNGRNQVQSTAA